MKTTKASEASNKCKEQCQKRWNIVFNFFLLIKVTNTAIAGGTAAHTNQDDEEDKSNIKDHIEIKIVFVIILFGLEF